MRILIYNWKDINNPLVGGAEIITFEYARRLVAAGHEVTWFTRWFADAEAEEMIDGVKIIRRGGAITTYWQGYRYYRSLPKKPDLVIDMLNTVAWQTPLYARRHSAVVQYVNQLAKEVWSYELPFPLSWVGRLLEPIQLLPYHHLPVVTYAPSTADDLAAWGYDRRNIHLFQLGLDHERYRPGGKADYPLFLQVCRMVRMKRPDVTVRAFAQVVRRHPQAKLALVGTGPFREALDQLVAELKLERNVLRPEKDIWFFKQVEGDQKVKLMQQAWCLVHPSVKEGWGMVITEAAACGTPSIVTAVSGQVDTVRDGETGLLVSKNPTVSELARAMERLIEDHDLRHQMEKNCLAFAAKFNWEESYRRFTHALTQTTGLPLEKIKQRDESELPSISIITPVFNAASVLPDYFTGIAQTSYPKDKLTIIMPDAGSTDQTRKLAQKHGVTLLENPLKTGEAGKAVGIKYVLAKLKAEKLEPKDHLICLLDSDNIIIDKEWFHRLVEPFFSDTAIVGAEPWEYIHRSHDSLITRYSALIGMSDPVAMFLGNYDRLNSLSGQWTELPIRVSDEGDFFVWTVDPKVVPTLGANGAVFRASFFASAGLGDYLFDIDVLYQYTLKHRARYAKVKIGIVHLFCRTLKDFIRKQKRRIKDFHYFHAMGLRTYPWQTINRAGLYYFVFSCLTVVPLLWQTAKGFARRPDSAWLFHLIACWVTLWIYGTHALLYRFKKPELADRANWSQG